MQYNLPSEYAIGFSKEKASATYNIAILSCTFVGILVEFTVASGNTLPNG